jgi:hypothetical protein
MSDVFDEISDDLRQQKLNQFWKENGSWIIGGAIGAVLLTGALTLWREHTLARNTEQTTQVVTLEKAGDLTKLDTFAGSADKDHAMMARFAEADAYIAKKQNDKALAVYDTIANTSGLDKTWRDLARLHSVSLRLDKDPPEALAKELATLDGDKDVWRYSAREMEALLAARQGQMQKAASLLSAIAGDPTVPDDMRQRAYNLHQLYVADTGETKKPDTNSSGAE